MSIIVIKIIGSLIISVISYIIAKNLYDNNDKEITIPTIIGIFFMVLPSCILYQKKYTSLVLLVTYITYIIVFKRRFNINMVTSIIGSSFILILITITDLLITSIELEYVSYSFVRTNIPLALVNNLLVGVLAYIISSIKILKKKIKDLTLKVDENNYLTIVVFAILIITVIALLYYNITSIFKFDIYYQVTSLSICIFIILSYLYLEERTNYQKLNDEYNFLFKYAQDFEEWIDDEQMYRHELKNNLSIIRNMTKNKKIIEKIDEMLKFSIIIDEQAIEDLKNIPKGGLKGLLYYKVALSKNKKVKMIVEVSPKVLNKLKKLKENRLRQLCIVLGIYLDNAIEASTKSKEKEVTLEIYEINKDLNFVISNSYKEFIPIKNMNKKGYTAKGNGHGKGLYYVKKILNKTRWLDTSQMFLNNYFVQKIHIK